MANNLAYYIRLSEADEDTGKEKDESESISNQRALILKYLKDHPEFDDWNIHEFVDDGYTGTNGDRPQFQRMVDLVQQRAIQCVIVKDLSRFARNYILLGEYMEQIFPYLGVRFIAINDGYDNQKTTSATDNMSVVLKSVLNAYYSKELSHKIRATIYLKMQRKERLGMAPFGYVLDESRTQYLIDPEAAKTVKLIFDLALQLKSTTKVADYLNVHQIPTITEYYRERPQLGKTHFPLSEHPQWDSTKVWHLLRDKAYMGTLVLRKSTVVVPASKRIRQTDESEQIVFEDAQAQKLTHRMARIADGFLEIHDLYTAKNKWLNLFSSIPEDFILTQELTRKTVKRITLLPGQPPIITFKQEDSKDLLFQKLNLVSRICREQSNQKEVSEHGE